MQGKLFELCPVHTASLAGKILPFNIWCWKKKLPLIIGHGSDKVQSRILFIKNHLKMRTWILTENLNLNALKDTKSTRFHGLSTGVAVAPVTGERLALPSAMLAPESPSSVVVFDWLLSILKVWLLDLTFEIWENYCKALPRNRNTMEPLLNSTRREKCPLNKRERYVTELEDAWKKACSCLINNLRQDLHFWFWNV